MKISPLLLISISSPPTCQLSLISLQMSSIGIRTSEDFVTVIWAKIRVGTRIWWFVDRRRKVTACSWSYIPTNPSTVLSSTRINPGTTIVPDLRERPFKNYHLIICWLPPHYLLTILRVSTVSKLQTMLLIFQRKLDKICSVVMYSSVTSIS